MVILGEVIISEKAVENVSLQTICKELEIYREDGHFYMEGYRSGRINVETEIIFKKEIYMGNRLILYIETYKNGATKVLGGMEYLERKIKNPSQLFNNRENNFLKVILQDFIENGTRYEKKTADRIIKKLDIFGMEKG